jgi:hypothetical protein
MTRRRDPILEEHYAALRDGEDTRPPEDLVNRAVLRAVTERQREEGRTDPWARLRRLLRPRVLRLRLAPTTALLAAAATVAAIWAGDTLTRRGEPLELAAAAPEAAPTDIADPAALEAREVPVRFVLPAEGAESVAVAGDFNEWQVGDMKLTDPEGDGVFIGTVWLPPGTYSYMFVVDGERWVTDPYASNYRNDGFGQKNAVLRID